MGARRRRTANALPPQPARRHRHTRGAYVPHPPRCARVCDAGSHAPINTPTERRIYAHHCVLQSHAGMTPTPSTSPSSQPTSPHGHVAGLIDVDNLISFEAFSRPGCFIATADLPATARGATEPPPTFRQLRLSCMPAGNNASSAQRKAASFKRHDPLMPAAHGSFQSYEVR